MLTKNDLQLIREVIQEEVPAIVKSEITPLKEDVSVLKQDVSVLKSDVSVLKSDVSVLKSDMRSVKRRLTRMRKEMRWMAQDYTNAIVPIRKRVEKIEDHLHLS